jgi:hypothetical protein
VSKHVEFPELTPETRAAYGAGCLAAPFSVTAPTLTDRRYLAAFLREAIRQVRRRRALFSELEEIADNLHSPPPPPPTLAQARAADLDTLDGIETVRAFLASLQEGGQP